MEFDVVPTEAAQHEIPLGGSQFPPIADYGFLSDCEVCALVALSGNVEWMCLPRMDGPSVFAGVLDRHAGRFRVGPRDEAVPADRRYLPGTMILETTWGTPTGWLVVRDVLVVGPWHHGEERSHRYARSPRDHEAAHVLLRTLRCLNGFVDVEMDCEPAFDYARKRGSWHYEGDGYGDGVCTVEGQSMRLRLRSDMRLGFEGPRARAETRLRAGETRFCALGWSEHLPPATFDEARARLPTPATSGTSGSAAAASPTIRGACTCSAPRSRSRASRTRRPARSSRPPRRRCRRRRAASATGTTATPGCATPRSCCGGCRRSASTARRTTSSISSWTALEAGGHAADHVRDRRARAPRRGGARRTCPATRARKPVRVGNGAWDQRQHDVWGVLLDSVRLHVRSGDRLDDRMWPLIVQQVDAAVAEWREPDRGIWEVRGEPRHFTSSKVFCWVAADRGARLARLRGDRAAADALARGGRRDARGDLRARGRRARRLRPALRDRRARRVAAADPAARVPAARTTRACARPCWRSPTS